MDNQELKCMICGHGRMYSYRQPICFACNNKLKSETALKAKQMFLTQMQLPPDKQSENFQILIPYDKPLNEKEIAQIREIFISQCYYKLLNRKYRDLRKKFLQTHKMPIAIYENICPECGLKCKKYTLCSTCYNELFEEIANTENQTTTNRDDVIMQKVNQKLQWYKNTYPQNYITK